MKVAEAAGGVFTDNTTHEFQVVGGGGEDTIFYCDKCSWCVNKEIFDDSLKKCPKCKGNIIKDEEATEVGNIFPFGTYYSELMRVYFTDAKGKKKPVWFGSYGIGSTRVMGTWVEVSHDDKGIVWNKAIAPFDVHLIEIPGTGVSADVKRVYKRLEESGLEILWDDRKVSAGEKFSESDLIGIPVRLVVSEKTGKKVEYKERDQKNPELFSLEEIVKKLTN